MSDTQHPMAPHELPGFLATADGSDKLMVLVVILLLLLLLVVGNYYLKLHALPERMAYRTSSQLGNFAQQTHWLISRTVPARVR